MAKGCCDQTTCSCLIVGGDGIAVSGSGTLTNPYVITADLPDFAQSLTVRDTTSVNLTLTGSGQVEDPFVLQANATLRLTALADVDDPEGGPDVGDVPVWVGVGADGHWEFDIPPVAPAGAVNATGGIAGIGSVGSPLLVKVSGVWGVAPLNTLGSDPDIGLEIYLDSSGELRARPGVGTVNWADIAGKPTTFTPSAHTHVASAITDPQNLDVGKIAGHRIYSTPGSSIAPTSPAPAAGDLWFYS
jgi:hypothetical protein